MIRTDAEHRQALEQLEAQTARLAKRRGALKAEGRTPAEIRRLLEPIESFRDGIAEDVALYEGLRRGEFPILRNLDGLGRLLISLRIAKGISQRELAERLEVHESQISRDERHEYHNVTLERAGRVLEAIGAELTTRVTGLGSESTEVA